MNTPTQPSALTGAEVALWFTAALQGKNVSAPSVDACTKMAERIREVESQRAQESQGYPELGKRVRNSANTFLKHLPAARLHSERQQAEAEGVPAIQSDFQRVLDDMQRAEDAVRQLLKTCNWATKPGNPKYALAHHMRALAIMAWWESGISEFPDIVSYKDAPMCRIVTSALTSMGTFCSRDAVSKMLLGERGGREPSPSIKAEKKYKTIK